MPKLVCRCNHVMRIDFKTESHEQCLVPLGFIEDAVLGSERQQLDGEKFFDDFSAIARDVYPCPECGRIYIETEERSGEFDIYIKEDKQKP